MARSLKRADDGFRLVMQISPDLLKSAWFLAGPTASGKSAVGLELAARIGAEIVCLDSMTIYRGMDIGTAKPTREDRLRCPHHLLDVVEPHQEFSVAEYLVTAETACRDILSRQRIPLFVGGTGLYLRSVLRGVFEGPAADWGLRQRWEAAAAGQDELWLREKLAEVDPESAQRLHPRDRRRIIRALEVYELTGRPLSQQQQQGPLPAAFRPAHVYWLSPQREDLYGRIDRRVETMFAQGFLQEVRRLLAAEQPLGRTARQALGYQEVIDWLEHSGDATSLQPPRAVWDEIQLRTRQFAKRQHTWFRNLEECQAVEIVPGELPAEIAGRLVGR